MGAPNPSSAVTKDGREFVPSVQRTFILSASVKRIYPGALGLCTCRNSSNRDNHHRCLALCLEVQIAWISQRTRWQGTHDEATVIDGEVVCAGAGALEDS